MTNYKNEFAKDNNGMVQEILERSERYMSEQTEVAFEGGSVVFSSEGRGYDWDYFPDKSYDLVILDEEEIINKVKTKFSLNTFFTQTMMTLATHKYWKQKQQENLAEFDNEKLFSEVQRQLVDCYHVTNIEYQERSLLKENGSLILMHLSDIVGELISRQVSINTDDGQLTKTLTISEFILNDDNKSYDISLNTGVVNQTARAPIIDLMEEAGYDAPDAALIMSALSRVRSLGGKLRADELSLIETLPDNLRLQLDKAIDRQEEVFSFEQDNSELKMPTFADLVHYRFLLD